MILSAPHRVSGAGCAALEQIPGVRASGAMSESTRSMIFSALPGAPVPEYHVTPGFVTIVGASSPVWSGLILSADVATTLGLKPGDAVATSAGNVSVSSTYTYPADGRRSGFGYAALVVGHDQGQFDECWVDAWPQVEGLRAVLFTALIPDSTSPSDSDSATVSQLNGSWGATFTGGQHYAHRVTRFATPALFVLSVFVAFVSVWVRRLQFAFALHSRVSKADLILTSVLEACAWALPASVLSAVCAITPCVHVSAADGAPLLASELGISCAGFVGAGIGAFLATLLIREKYLVRFFTRR